LSGTKSNNLKAANRVKVAALDLDSLFEVSLKNTRERALPVWSGGGGAQRRRCSGALKVKPPQDPQGSGLTGSLFGIIILVESQGVFIRYHMWCCE